MNTSALKFAKLILPPPLRRGLRYGFDPDYRQLLRMERDKETGRIVFPMTGGIVCAGPFAGLRFSDTEAGFTLGPKLLGTYEKELDGTFIEILRHPYDTIVNIGAGDGFYAVGIGRNFPHCQLICFETIDWKHEQIQSLADLNQSQGRIRIFGTCGHEDLTAVLQISGKTLIVCDIEGAELQLLDPAITPRLREVDMLVEMHDIIHPGISETIHQRFETTHKKQVIASQIRTIDDWPSSIKRPRNWARLLDESRGGQMTWSWLRCRPTPPVASH